MSEPQPIGRKTRVWIAGAMLAAMLGIIVATTAWGSPSNSLHTSAQAWAFSVAAAILAGLGLGSVVEIFKR